MGRALLWKDLLWAPLIVCSLYSHILLVAWIPDLVNHWRHGDHHLHWDETWWITSATRALIKCHKCKVLEIFSHYIPFQDILKAARGGSHPEKNWLKSGLYFMQSIRILDPNWAKLINMDLHKSNWHLGNLTFRNWSLHFRSSQEVNSSLGYHSDDCLLVTLMLAAFIKIKNLIHLADF